MRVLNIFLFCYLTITANAQVFSDETEILEIEPFLVEIQYGSGANLIDVDQNGYIDLFVIAGVDSPNSLFLNTGESWSEAITIGNKDLNSRAAVWFDFDNDRLLDVFIVSDCANNSECFDQETFALYKNIGDNTFEDVSEASLLVSGARIQSEISTANYTGGVAAGDVNLDGFLDLIITRWGGELFLFLNNGDGTFSNASSTLNQQGLHFYWQPLIFNMDEDPWPEIFVTLDADEENIYLNRNIKNGTYTNLAAQYNLNHKFHDMGVVIGDYDNDADYDLYITNIERFENSRNILYTKVSDSQYQDYAKSANVDKAGWSWGVTFNDFNNDGILDLGVTNGWDAHNQYRHDQSRLWLGTNNYEFTDASDQTNFNDTLNASVLVAADLDRDGDIDLVQGLKTHEKNQNIRLLKNNLKSTCTDCNYIVVKPRMMGQNHLAIGSSVSIWTNAGVQMRAITSGIGYYGQEPAEAFFGLGSETTIDHLTVKWPSGDSTILSNVEANQELYVYDSISVHSVGYVDVSTLNETSIKLKWGHMSTTETHYIIQRSEQIDFSSYDQFVVDIPLKEFTDVNLKSFTDYYYRLKAANSSKESRWSDTYFGTTRLNAPPPTEFKANLIDNSYAKLSWVDTTEIGLDFELQRSLHLDFESYLSLEIPNDMSIFYDTNVEPGYTYFYRIRQISDNYHCPFSQIESVSVPEIIDQNILNVNSGTDNDWLIYPNPSAGLINFKSKKESVDFIHLYSLSGRLLQSFKIEPDQESINITDQGEFILSFYLKNKLIHQSRVSIF